MEPEMPLPSQYDAVWGDTLCANCGARLSTWADTLHGCCARCGHAFPEAFRWLHEAAIKEREEAPKRTQLAAKQEQQRMFRRDAEPFLKRYVAARPAAEPFSRLELIARLRSQTGLRWIDCRDFVEQFIAENPALSASMVRPTAHEVFQSVFAE